MSSHNDSFVSSGSSPTESSGPDFIVENHRSEYKGAARDACALTQGPKRRGRPRKYENDATKQADYRRREELKQELKKTDEQINSQGRLHGETLYGPEKVEQIAAAIAQEKFIGGRKVGPPQANNPKQSIGDWRESGRKTGRITSVDTGEFRMERIRFPKNWRLTDEEKSDLIDRLCPHLFQGKVASPLDEDGTEQDHGKLTCSLCGYQCDYLANARGHLHQEYDRAVLLRTKYNRLAREFKNDFENPTVNLHLKNMREDLIRNEHFHIIEDWFKYASPQGTKSRRPKGNFVTQSENIDMLLKT